MNRDSGGVGHCPSSVTIKKQRLHNAASCNLYIWSVEPWRLSVWAYLEPLYITKLQQNRYVGILRLYFTLISAWQHICTAPNFPRPGAGILPTAIEIITRSQRAGPLATSWANFSDFWSLQRGTKKTWFFGIAPKEQKSHNQWPKVTSGIILGPIFNDLGSNFNIDLSTFRTIDSASICHWCLIDFRNSSNL